MVMELDERNFCCLCALEVCCSQYAEHQLQLLANLSWILKNRVRFRNGTKGKKRHRQKNVIRLECLSREKGEPKAKLAQDSRKTDQSFAQKFWASFWVLALHFELLLQCAELIGLQN